MAGLCAWVYLPDLTGVITTKKKSTFQTPIGQTADSSTTLHKLDKLSTEDAYCDEQSCPNEPIKTSTEISDQG